MPFCFLALFFTARICYASTIPVPAESPTIQAGIDAAADDDTVLVATGTYSGDGNRDIDFGGKRIVVKSADGPDVTTINCEGTVDDPHRGFIFKTYEGPESVLDGFLIKGGVAGWGGGVYCSDASPTIANCVLAGNHAWTLDEEGLVVAGSGGGMYCYQASPTLIGCTFCDNVGGTGRGIYIGYSSPRITDCLFLPGGEVNVSSLGIPDGAAPIFRNCEFDGRNSRSGPALDCVTGSPQLIDCELHDYSGGTAVVKCRTEASLRLTRCLIHDNAARGIYCQDSRLSMTGCTVAQNELTGSSTDGAGLYLVGTVATVQVSIIAYNNGGMGIYHRSSPFDPTPLTMVCNDIYGNEGGDYEGMTVTPQLGINGNISADPIFCDTVSGDFHLNSSSPCIAEKVLCGERMGALGIGCQCNCSNQGDSDADGNISPVDVVRLINYALRNGEEPPADQYCPAPNRSEFNCDGYINLVDLVSMINYVYRGPAPGPCDPCEL